MKALTPRHRKQRRGLQVFLLPRCNPSIHHVQPWYSHNAGAIGNSWYRQWWFGRVTIVLRTARP